MLRNTLYLILLSAPFLFADGIISTVSDDILTIQTEKQLAQKEYYSLKKDWLKEKSYLNESSLSLEGELARVLLLQKELEQELSEQEGEYKLLAEELKKDDSLKNELTPLYSHILKELKEKLQQNFLPYPEYEQRLLEVKKLKSRGVAENTQEFLLLWDQFRLEISSQRQIRIHEGVIESEEGKILSADLLQVGQVLLYYSIRDFPEVGYYNKSEKKWCKIDDPKLSSEIKKSLKIHLKRSPPDLVYLPSVPQLNKEVNGE
ncbi:MAG: DUF3450 family protein [Planctomycetes bacterium]|nr:DUF3450 family protein [Planctomycetota bacterium]